MENQQIFSPVAILFFSNQLLLKIPLCRVFLSALGRRISSSSGAERENIFFKESSSPCDVSTRVFYTTTVLFAMI
jgi:hypothetical protein